MSKSKKILNYIAMACAIIATIIFCTDQNWNAALWAVIAFAWMINSFLTEDNYYFTKENLDKLTDDYFTSLIKHKKELKELKGEIESLKKGK